jgi:hypothetical protein
MQLFFSRFAIALQPRCNRFAIALLWRCFRFLFVSFSACSRFAFTFCLLRILLGVTKPPHLTTPPSYTLPPHHLTTSSPLHHTTPPPHHHLSTTTTNQQLKQPADVFISETFDAALLGERFISILSHAKSSGMLRKDAVIIPSAAVVHVQLLQSTVSATAHILRFSLFSLLFLSLSFFFFPFFLVLFVCLMSHTHISITITTPQLSLPAGPNNTAYRASESRFNLEPMRK